MYLRIFSLVLLFCSQLVVESTCEKNVTKDNISKRGIYHLSDGLHYNIIPIQHFTRYPPLRNFATEESSHPHVDLTYKPSVEISGGEKLPGEQYQTQQFTHQDSVKNANNVNTNQLKNPGLLHQAHQSQNYGSTQQQQQSQQQLYSLPVPQKISAEQQIVPHQHLVSPHYPITLHPRLTGPLTIYGAEKLIALPTNGEIKLPEYSETYTTIPVIYGQSNGNLPSLKYINQGGKQQHSLPLSYGNTQNQPQNIISQQQYNKLAAKLQQAQGLPTQHQRQNNQQARLHSPALQTTQQFKSFDPNYYQPQVFENPIVPQLQHFLPRIKSPFDAFTRQQVSAPAPLASAAPTHPPQPPTSSQAPHTSPAPQSTQASKEEESDEEEDDDREGRRHIKEEVQGEVVREEENDEEEFEKGYENSAVGFPAYGQKEDRDDEFGYPDRYHSDSNDRYQRYKSRYRDDEDEDRETYHRERDQRPREYDDDRRGRQYTDRDHEGHFSEKHHRHEPKSSNREHKSSKYSSDSRKPYRKEESERSSSKQPSHSSKYQKSNKPSRKAHSDNRYAGSSQKKHNSKVNTPRQKQAASSRSEVEITKPNYQYGFEPIKGRSEELRSKPDDLVAKHSSPHPTTKKIYKENWYISKSVKSKI